MRTNSIEAKQNINQIVVDKGMAAALTIPLRNASEIQKRGIMICFKYIIAFGYFLKGFR